MIENRLVKNFKKLPKKNQRIFWITILILALLNIISYITSQLMIGPEVRTFEQLFLIAAALEFFVLIGNLIMFWVGDFEKAVAFIYIMMATLLVLGIFAKSMRFNQSTKDYKSSYQIHQQEKLMNCSKQILPECIGTSYYGGNIKCETDADCQPAAMLEYCNGLEISYVSDCENSKYFCGAFGDCKICESCY